MLRMAGNHLKPEEVWKDFSLETSKGAWTGQDLDFRLWASVLDGIDFYCFKPPNLWYILYCSSLNLGIEESAQNVGDLGSIPESGRSHREGNGYPFRYSCLENSMTEEPGGLQPLGSQRVGHDWLTISLLLFRKWVQLHPPHCSHHHQHLPPPQLHYYENIVKKILQITSFQANTGTWFYWSAADTTRWTHVSILTTSGLTLISGIYRSSIFSFLIPKLLVWAWHDHFSPFPKNKDGLTWRRHQRPFTLTP